MKDRIPSVWLWLSCLLFLHACSSGNDQLAEGGISGTGITMGRISAFGSIITNGIEFNTDNARFIRDNNTVNSQDSYAVGEVVTIQGSINADGTTGTASSVSFADILEGPVAETPPLLATSFKVLGQTIHVSDLTIFHGFKRIAHLTPADIVEVSGFYTANGNIHASSITLKTTTTGLLELKGKISNLNQASKTFTINELMVNYANAQVLSSNGQLTDNQRVEISAQVLIDNTLFATSVTPVSALTLTPDEDFEIEGIITRFNSASDFYVDAVHVLATEQTTFKDGIKNELALNALIEVEGVINQNGILIADSIELEATDNLPIIEANIDAIDYQENSLVVFGKTIHTDLMTILFDESQQQADPLYFDQIRVGEYVDIKLKIQSDGSLLAVRLSREDQETDYTFRAIIENINPNDASFTLFGIPMISTPDTLYLDSNEQPIDLDVFFASVTQGVSRVEIEGKPSGNTIVLDHAMLVDTTP